MLIPKNRHEYYLAVISGNDYPTFPPKIREEQYLAKLVGREVDVPNPKTPKERAYFNIINDIKFEPENRWQTFVAAANDDSITAPVPRTREEIWWSNITLSQEVIVEYTGTLPTTLQTVEGYLESYKIYGNTEQIGAPTPENPIVPSECGERTENLFNFDESSQGAGYASNMIMTAGGTFATNAFFISEHIPVIPGQSYIYFTDLFRSGQGVIKFYNITNGTVTYLDRTPQKNAPSRVSYSPTECATFTVPTNTSLAVTHMRINVDKEATMFFIVEGSTAPTSYEPYGYKLPLTSGNTPVDIYIGDDTLSTEEYVDSGTGKIYHMVDGVLTPTDPPMPFPQIPTTANSTTISWGGQGLAPSEVELAYKTIKKSYISADDKVYQDPNGQLLGG